MWENAGGRNAILNLKFSIVRFFNKSNIGISSKSSVRLLLHVCVSSIPFLFAVISIFGFQLSVSKFCSLSVIVEKMEEEDAILNLIFWFLFPHFLTKGTSFNTYNWNATHEIPENKKKIKKKIKKKKGKQKIPRCYNLTVNFELPPSFHWSKTLTTDQKIKKKKENTTILQFNSFHLSKTLTTDSIIGTNNFMPLPTLKYSLWNKRIKTHLGMINEEETGNYRDCESKTKIDHNMIVCHN